MQQLAAFVTGLVFSTGLIISGMINPAKVIGFLDLFGAWDPSLAFVMLGAVAVNFIGLRVILNRPHPAFANGFSLPTRRDIARPLILGATLFGLGWGLAGLCPGPALAALTAAPTTAAGFVAAMLIGMAAGQMAKGTAPTRTDPA
mgnify:CR=1 FL=1